jgi:hypothetical protein
MNNLSSDAIALFISSKALKWVAQNIKYFDPFSESVIPNTIRKQALCELVLLFLVLRRNDFLCKLEASTYISKYLCETSFHPFFQASLGRWNHSIVPALYFLAFLKSIEDKRYPHQKEKVCQFLHASNSLIVERFPYRLLELRHAAYLADLECDLPSTNCLLTNTLLQKKPSLLFLTDDDIYAVTHTVFYATDFGANPTYVWSSNEIENIRALLEPLIALYIRRKNLDILGELIMAERCLGSLSNSSIWGLDLLSTSQHQEGHIDGPYRKSTYASAEIGPQIFRECYHTTLVAALMGAVMLQNSTLISCASHE